MVVRNTFCKRIIIGYCIFFLTVIIIWKHHAKSIKLEEDEDTLKPIISPYFTNTSHRTTTIVTTTKTKTTITTTITTTTFKEILNEKIDESRLEYWLKNNSRTLGINLTAILAPKRSGKYLVYVCHENCGGKIHLIAKKNNFYLFKVGEIVFGV